MLLLISTTDKLQLTTGAAATLDVIASYVDSDNANPPVVQGDTMGTQLTAITTATTTDIVAAPASNERRNVKTLHIRNKHASLATDVTVIFDRSSTDYELYKCNLASGESLQYVEGVGFFEVAASTATKPTTGAATTSSIASHSADTYYLGMNYSGRIQAGTYFRWAWRSSKGAAGTATPIYTIRVGNAGTTADTARVTLTGVAQTAATDNGYFVVEAAFRVVGASAILQANQSVQHSLAATGFANVSSPSLTGTSAAFDSGASAIIGLSVNPGTSGAWVTDLVTLDGVNMIDE